MVDFLLPLILAAFGGNKFFCNHLCGRGQLYCKRAEISNAPETSQHRNGWHPNGFDMVFWYFSLPCSAIWFFRPTFWQAVRKICVKQSNCFGHSVFRGDGHIRKVYSRIGWHSSASDFTAWCLHRFYSVLLLWFSLSRERGALSARWEQWHRQSAN